MEYSQRQGLRMKSVNRSYEPHWARHKLTQGLHWLCMAALIMGFWLALNAGQSAQAQAPGTPLDQGPGGPILVVSDDAFSRYYAEILRTEGVNAFAVSDITAVTAATLATYDVVILDVTALTDLQVTMVTDWVNAGGNLIAMRPDRKLASLLGLTATSPTPLTNGYLLANTSTAPGAGIVNQTIQFRGPADLYTLNGATSIATLYSNATTATTEFLPSRSLASG